MAKAAPRMRLAPDLDTGPAQLGRGGVCEGCAAKPLALLQRREKQAAARHPVGRVWPFSRRRPVRLTACGRLVGGEQPGGLQSSEQHEATGERTASANTALRKGAFNNEVAHKKVSVAAAIAVASFVVRQRAARK